MRLIEQLYCVILYLLYPTLYPFDRVKLYPLYNYNQIRFSKGKKTTCNKTELIEFIEETVRHFLDIRIRILGHDNRQSSR